MYCSICMEKHTWEVKNQIKGKWRENLRYCVAKWGAMIVASRARSSVPRGLSSIVDLMATVQDVPVSGSAYLNSVSNKQSVGFKHVLNTQ